MKGCASVLWLNFIKLEREVEQKKGKNPMNHGSVAFKTRRYGIGLGGALNLAGVILVWSHSTCSFAILNLLDPNYSQVLVKNFCATCTKVWYSSKTLILNTF